MTVSCFWDSWFSTQLPTFIAQTVLHSVVRLQERDFFYCINCLFLSPEWGGEVKLGNHEGGKQCFFGERILELAGRSQSSSFPTPQLVPRAGSTALNNTLAFMEMYQMFQEPPSLLLLPHLLSLQDIVSTSLSLI